MPNNTSNLRERLLQLSAQPAAFLIVPRFRRFKPRSQPNRMRSMLSPDELCPTTCRRPTIMRLIPLGSLTVWMQELDESKPLREAMHIDVSVAREHVVARLEAARVAGGRIVDDSHSRSH